MKLDTIRSSAAFLFHSNANVNHISPAILRFALGRHVVTCT